MPFHLFLVFTQNFSALCYDRNFQRIRKFRANVICVVANTEFKMNAINHYIFHLFNYALISFSLFSRISTALSFKSQNCHLCSSGTQFKFETAPGRVSIQPTTTDGEPLS
jgi:hypothetical protein